MTKAQEQDSGQVFEPPVETAVIEAHNLARFYGEVVGLSDLSVRIPPGITGLVGPNGAGKSTFMKCIVGELRPARGTISVLGEEPFANPALYRRLGFCPQQDALYDHLSGLGFVEYLLRLAGFSKPEARRRAAWSLERVHLEDSMHRKCSGYSKGMRQRVRIAQALAHEPELIVLDEPMSGLDPLVRHQMKTLFLELAEAGVSLLVSSHVLHELQGLSERVVLIHRGRLLAQGSVAEIRDLLAHHPRRIRVEATRARALALSLAEATHVRSVSFTGADSFLLETADAATCLDDIAEQAERLQPGLSSLALEDESLEAVFDYLLP